MRWQSIALLMPFGLLIDAIVIYLGWLAWTNMF
jgi:hypothetical protein